MLWLKGGDDLKSESLTIVIPVLNGEEAISETISRCLNARKQIKKQADIFLSISASVTIAAYILYCIDLVTTQLHDTTHLIYTTPFVIYCIYRYTLKVQE